MATATLERPITTTAPSTDPSIHRQSDTSNLINRAREAAVRYLVAKDYEVLERDWTCFAGKTDIIAKDDDSLVFVKVNVRTDHEQGFPKDDNGSETRERFEKSALAYLACHEDLNLRVRYDTVAVVVLSGGKALVRHHINALTVI